MKLHWTKAIGAQHQLQQPTISPNASSPAYGHRISGRGLRQGCFYDGKAKETNRIAEISKILGIPSKPTVDIDFSSRDAENMHVEV